MAKKRKSASFRLALSGDAAKTDARDACGVIGNDKGGSQLLSLQAVSMAAGEAVRQDKDVGGGGGM